VTAMAAWPLPLVQSEPVQSGGDRPERVRALLRPEFLAEVWDAADEVFAPPREHPLLGLRKCAVIDCEAGVRTPNTDLCKLCIEKYKVSGLTMDQFTAIPANKISKSEQFCRVPGRRTCGPGSATATIPRGATVGCHRKSSRHPRRLSRFRRSGSAGHCRAAGRRAELGDCATRMWPAGKPP
jgi:hypothetical protein